MQLILHNEIEFADYTEAAGFHTAYLIHLGVITVQFKEIKDCTRRQYYSVLSSRIFTSYGKNKIK